MKPLFLILLTLIFFFILPQIWRPQSVQSPLQTIIYYWLILTPLIGIYEFFLVYKGLSYSPQSFWEKEYSIVDILTPNFWLDGFAEYAKSDTRYFEGGSLTNRIEFTHMLLTFLPSLYALINFEHAKPILLYIGLAQLATTSVYFWTLFRKRYYLDPIYRWYWLFNLPWIFFPLVLIFYSFSDL